MEEGNKEGKKGKKGRVYSRIKSSKLPNSNITLTGYSRAAEATSFVWEGFVFLLFFSDISYP